MRSILGKVLIWSLGTLALSLIAYWGIERALKQHGPTAVDPFWRMVSLVEEDTCDAFEKEGAEGLAAHLRRLDAKLSGHHLLTDPRGRDLATGEDRSALLALTPPAEGQPRLADGRLVFVGKPRGGRYRYVTLIQPWFDPPNLLPYYTAVVLVIVLMGVALAAYLATPLRRLRDVVERFGRGDLSARSRSGRRDEIGELARAFDEMAGRIETLLAAERQLLQDVSHELRSPLARLGFAVELARSGGDPGPALDRVRREADRMTALVEELLDLSRAECGLAGGDEEIALREVVAELFEDCGLEAEARGCRLDLHLDGDGGVLGVRELLRRAIENVLRNAIRHAPEGTAVDLSLEAVDGEARVTVLDRGPGVPEDLLDSIFRPFVRVEGDRSRTSGGVGLGLAIARRAIELHRGRISARNAGPGLAVEIVLPTA